MVVLVDIWLYSLNTGSKKVTKREIVEREVTRKKKQNRDTNKYHQPHQNTLVGSKREQLSNAGLKESYPYGSL